MYVLFYNQKPAEFIRLVFLFQGGVYRGVKKKRGRKKEGCTYVQVLLFMHDGWHTPAVELENEEAAVRYAMIQKDLQHEVRIVDESDSIILQTIKGEVVYPTKDMCGKEGSQ